MCMVSRLREVMMIEAKLRGGDGPQPDQGVRPS